LSIQPEIDKGFLKFWLRHLEQFLDLYCTSNTQKNLNAEKVRNLPLAFAPLPEQKQIARFLDHETGKIDLLIEKQQALIALLKEKRQAVISHAVTKGLNPHAPMKDSGVEWLGQVPEGWEIPKLIHKSNRIGDGLHSTPSYEDGTGYYFVNGNNLVDGVIHIGSTAKEVPASELKKHHIHLGSATVLLSINGTIGNVAGYHGESIILGKSAAYINCKADLRVCRTLFLRLIINMLSMIDARKICNRRPQHTNALTP
jgi:type I restriction enzyme S subunit